MFHWIYRRGITDFAAMTNLPKALRGRLAEAWTVDASWRVAVPGSVSSVRARHSQ